MWIFRTIWPLVYTSNGLGELNRYSRLALYRAIFAVCVVLAMMATAVNVMPSLFPAANAWLQGVTPSGVRQSVVTALLAVAHGVVDVEVYITHHYLHLVFFGVLSALKVLFCVRATHALYQLHLENPDVDDYAYQRAKDIVYGLRHGEVALSGGEILVLLTLVALPIKLFTGYSINVGITLITITVLPVLWYSEGFIVRYFLSPNVMRVFKNLTNAMPRNNVEQSHRRYQGEPSNPHVYKPFFADSYPRRMESIIYCDYLGWRKKYELD